MGVNTHVARHAMAVRIIAQQIVNVHVRVVVIGIALVVAKLLVWENAQLLVSLSAKVHVQHREPMLLHKTHTTTHIIHRHQVAAVVAPVVVILVPQLAKRGVKQPVKEAARVTVNQVALEDAIKAAKTPAIVGVKGVVIQDARTRVIVVVKAHAKQDVQVARVLVIQGAICHVQALVRAAA